MAARVAAEGAGPVVGFLVTQRVAIGLQARDREQLAHGYETGRIVRMPGGQYEEIHRGLDAETARALGTGPITEAIPTRHGDGWRTPLDVLRVGLAHWYERGASRSAPDSAPDLARDALPAALPRSLAGTARRP